MWPLAIYFLILLAPSQHLVWVYPLTILAVAAALWLFRKDYDELQSPPWAPRLVAPRPSGFQPPSALSRS